MNELVEVTFQVDMQNETVSSSGVFLRGNFNGWDSNEPLENDGTVYYTILELEHGAEVQYKFVNGDVWEEPTPGACTKTTDATNRFFIVPDENITLDTVCFNSCSACNASEEKVNVTFRVDIQNETVSPDGVFLGGDWNSWHTWVDEKVEMVANGSIYTATVELPVGLSMIYKFGNGDQWEDEIPGDCTVGDNNDRQLTVPETDITLDIVCFESCEACETAVVDKSIFDDLIVSPNPAENKIQISGLAKIDTEILLFDGNGRLLLKNNARNVDSEILDISDISKGVYFLRFIRNKEAEYTVKILKK